MLCARWKLQSKGILCAPKGDSPPYDMWTFYFGNMQISNTRLRKKQHSTIQSSSHAAAKVRQVRVWWKFREGPYRWHPCMGLAPIWQARAKNAREPPGRSLASLGESTLWEHPDPKRVSEFKERLICRRYIQVLWGRSLRLHTRCMWGFCKVPYWQPVPVMTLDHCCFWVHVSLTWLMVAAVLGRDVASHSAVAWKPRHHWCPWWANCGPTFRRNAQ